MKPIYWIMIMILGAMASAILSYTILIETSAIKKEELDLLLAYKYAYFFFVLMIAIFIVKKRG